MKELEQPAEVIDITPLRCPTCGSEVEAEDAYCEACGKPLLEERTALCPHCGRAVHADASFCAECGTNLLDTIDVAAPTGGRATEELPRSDMALDTSDEEELPADAKQGFWRSRRFVSVVAILLAVGLAAAGWFLTRPTDLTSFDAGVEEAVAAAEAAAESLHSLEEPGALAGFADAIEESHEGLEAAQRLAARVPDEEHRIALEALVSDEQELFDELIRLGRLPSASIDESEFTALPDLITGVDAAIGEVHRLRSVAGVMRSIEFEETTLRRTLFDLAAYREEILKQRNRIRSQNEARADQLAGVEAFVGDMDGIISRYSASRQELSHWIETTNAGATWAEAYQTLEQQQDRRSQLRTELAAWTLRVSSSVRRQRCSA